jgi:chemotaxis protein histidine kinase CheA
MAEPSLDLSEIMDLYKEDARIMIGKMRAAHRCWEDYQKGGPARTDIRRLAHQLRGSGRTYGFRQVSRYSKAIENITIKIDKAHLAADDRARESIAKKIDLLDAAFAAS